MKIIGIAGTNGSGKDSLGQILADEHGWLFVSVTNILRDGLRERGLSIERENLRDLSAEWRRESGLGVLVDKAVEIFERAPGQYKGLAIASLRNPGEADRIRELGGKVVWLDAEPKIRYERIHSRQRSTEDQKTFEEFLTEEEAEMRHVGGDEATLSLAGVKSKTGIFLQNNGNLEEFQAAAEKALGL